MTILYFAHPYSGFHEFAPQVDDTTERHVTIRGFDTAGNQLCAITAAPWITPKRIDVIDNGGPVQAYYVFDAYNSQGEAIEARTLAYNHLSSEDPPAPGEYNPPPNGWRATRVAVDSNGRIYAASAPAGSASIHSNEGVEVQYAGEYITESSLAYLDWIRVFRRDGDRVDFPQLHGAAIRAIVIDSSDNIYVGGDQTSGDRYHLRKYNSAGVLQWSVVADTHGSGFDDPVPREIIDDIQIGGDGYIYALGHVQYYSWSKEFSYARNKSFFAKYSGSDGAEQWKWHADSLGDFDGKQIFSFAISDDGLNLYTSCWRKATQGTPYTIVQRRTPSTGVVLAEDDRGGNDIYYAWLKIHGGYLHAVLNRRMYGGTGDIDYLKLNLTTLATETAESWEVFTYPNSQNPNLWRLGKGFAIDADGVFYYGRPQFEAGGFRGYTARTAAGADPWDGNPVLESSAGYADPQWGFTPESQNIASVTLVADTPIPPKSLPLRLAPFTWVGDIYTAAPAAALPFRLTLPSFRREYVGALRLPDVYRLLLTGSPDLELPLSSLSMRRNAASTTLTVVSPAASASTITAVLARASGELVLQRGVRFVDGTEQIETMVRADLTDYRADRGARSGSITLAGSAAPTGAIVSTRTLRGVSYRNTDTAGKRRVRCAVDTFLAPGDTALLSGGESLVVGELTYSISPTRGQMEVKEA